MNETLLKCILEGVLYRSRKGGTEKALVMSELLDSPDCLNPENAGMMAAALDIPDSLDRIRQVLTGAYCRDGKIWSIVKISLGKPV